MKEFIEALEEQDIDAIRKVPKSDLHNHSYLGGSLSIFEQLTGVKIEPAPKKLKDLVAMRDWINACFKPHINSIERFLLTKKATLMQAVFDGVTVLEMSLESQIFNQFQISAEQVIISMNEYHKEIAPDIDFRPELSIGKQVPPDEAYEIMVPYIDSGYFKSIDLCGIEEQRESKEYKPIYQFAKSKGLKLKAHAGEFCPAESIREAVEELELDEVQHGITAVESKEVMKFLQDNKIRLNVCPTSNIVLSRVESYEVHPARILYDNGIEITINTDDMIIFNQSVSEEFLNLYKAGLFSATELDEIRKNGLR